MANGEPPFDGRCHVCTTADAAVQVPISFNVMVERHIADDGGVRPTMTGGIELVAGAAEELWQSTRFPLLLCERCHTQFQSSQAWAEVKNFAKGLGLVAILGAFLYFAFHNAAVIAALSGVIWIVGALAWAASFRHNKKLDPFVLHWLSHIRWVPEAIAAEDEYKLSIGKSQLIEPK